MKLALRTRRQVDARTTALIRKAASVCLGYPDDAFPARLKLVRDAVDAEPFRAFAAYAASQDPYDLAAEYVETFDQRNRASLYLTWWTAGDTRNRGDEIIRFLRAYREAGFEYGGEELPDHLPVVLDFAACGGERAAEIGTALLAEHRGALEKLRDHLARRSPDAYPCPTALNFHSPW